MPLRLGILLCVATARAAPAPAVADELSAIKATPRQTTFTSVPSVLMGSSDGTCGQDGCGGPAKPNEDCGWGAGQTMSSDPQRGKPVGCTYCRGGECYYKKAPGVLCGSNNECQNNFCDKGHCASRIPCSMGLIKDSLDEAWELWNPIAKGGCMCQEFEDKCESCMCDGGESYCNAECRNKAFAAKLQYSAFGSNLPPDVADYILDIYTRGGPSSCCVPRLASNSVCETNWQCASFHCKEGMRHGVKQCSVYHIG